MEKLKKYYGDLKAVDGIGFEVEQGTVFGMLGPNGAGKTTTIEMLVGLTERTDGSVEVLGLDPGKEQDKLKKRIGVRLQSPALFNHLTVRELMDLYAGFYENAFDTKEVIEMLGLSDKANVRIETLSGGQFHKLATALAIISNGELIFLDEPSTGLDPQSRREIRSAILKLKSMGKTIFLTTHNMDEAEALCDDLIIIDYGKIIAKGSPFDLIAQYFGGKIIELLVPDLEKKDYHGFEKLEGVSKVDYPKEGKNINIYTQDYAVTIIDLINYTREQGINIENLEFRRPTLDDLFIELTGREMKSEGF